MGFCLVKDIMACSQSQRMATGLVAALEQWMVPLSSGEVTQW